ncbi:MAG: hypothetical protein ACRDY2_03290 [Acidimicrobiales bacterium]
MPSDGRARRLDPILRELLSEHLAVRQATGDDGTGWVLTEAVQHRLDELERVAPDPAKVALYFGHRCSVCNEFVTTRLIEGRHVCSDCAPGLVPAPGGEPGPK